MTLATAVMRFGPFSFAVPVPRRLRAAAAALGAAAGLAACALEPPFEAEGSPTALASYAHCQQGGAACVLKPAALLVLNDGDPSVDFDFRSWILYDPRPAPGQRYVALMNETNDPVCEGYYLSLVVNDVAPMAMTCFPRQARGRGELRFHSLQLEGPFAGKSAGTGVLETDGETVLLVHGATAEENRTAPFATLWDKYGGSASRLLGERERRATRIASLPRLARAPEPASASGGAPPGTEKDGAEEDGTTDSPGEPVKLEPAGS